MKHPKELSQKEVAEMSDRVSRVLKTTFGNNRIQHFMFINRDIVDVAMKEMYLAICDIIVRERSQ